MSTTTCGFCGSAYDAGLVSCPSCGGNSHIPDSALPSGTGLDSGKFTIVRVLGRGGFGITYEGYDETLHRTVAIKELFPEGAVRRGDLVAVPSIRQGAFQEERAQVVDEARRVASLKSSNIVDIYTAFRENNTVYIVMEFLSGHSLEHEINQSGSLKADDVQAIALTLCDALQVVHGQHMLHRDIKPANVMLTDDGRTVLIDFGAAREFVLHRTSQHTRLLTADYAAPEQYATEARFGPYTDIFSLGATLFHALSGSPPKNAIERSLNNETTLVLPDECQGPLGMAIQSSLHLRVDDRPQNIDAFRTLLQIEVHATKKRWPISRRWMFTAVAGITILLAVTIGLYSISQRQANLNLSPSVSFSPTATPTATHTSTPTNTPTPTRTSTATPTKRPTPTPAPQSSVNSDVDVRIGPGADFESRGILPAGREVNLLGTSTNGSWSLMDNFHWIPSAAITNIPDGLPVLRHPTTITNTNLRAAPDSGSALQGVLGPGTALLLDGWTLGSNPDGIWYHLDTGEWIWGDLVQDAYASLPERPVVTASVRTQFSKPTATLQPIRTPRPTTSPQTAANNYLIPFTRVPANSEWYKGGSLHKGTFNDWCNATSENRLATVADMVAYSLTNSGKQFGIDFDMEDLYRLSVSMIVEIEGMILDVWGCSETGVAEAFTLIWLTSRVE